MKNIDWNKIADLYIEMQQTGRQAIITLPEIEKDNCIFADGGEYYFYGLDLDAKEIMLLNVKEQLFGDFEDEIIYDERADSFSISEDVENTDTYHLNILNKLLQLFLINHNGFNVIMPK